MSPRENRLRLDGMRATEGSQGHTSGKGQARGEVRAGTPSAAILAEIRRRASAGVPRSGRSAELRVPRARRCYD
jgi:hypothetical protein